ncbi:MAG: U32 family peptidase, partial [Deltaproteobacteria bacterium]|nr:U32 family peptidase [Deltaproteobacteria bacterium]
SNYESINFYKRHFGIKRVILPRVLTVDEMKVLRQGSGVRGKTITNDDLRFTNLKSKIENRKSKIENRNWNLEPETCVELEVFALGGLCINVEGRCYLSSFVTGASTNTEGACSPSRFVRFINVGGERHARAFHGQKDLEPECGKLRITLNGVALNELSDGETSPYPTCCKGRYYYEDGRFAYALEEPESLNILEIISRVIEAGVNALKIEGRQRTRAYVGTMTRVLREAIDAYYEDPDGFRVRGDWLIQTNSTFEGCKPTLGCYLEK